MLTHHEIEGDVATTYLLVPANCYYDGQRFPHDIEQELLASDYPIVRHEGLEFFKIPNLTSTNAVSPALLRPQASSTAALNEEAESIPEAVKRYIVAAEIEAKPRKTRATKKSTSAAKKATDTQ